MLIQPDEADKPANEKPANEKSANEKPASETPAGEVPADDAAHILVVDDDKRIRELLSRFLRSKGYRISTAEHADEARQKLVGLSFDLIVLDVMMPGMNGYDFAQELRDTSDVPILMLTARTDIDDRLRGLAIGVDDYMGKPFDPRELLLRIGSILRRVATVAPPLALNAPETVQFGPFTFHLARGELRQGEEMVRITERERDILRLLSEVPGQGVSREALAGGGAGGGAGAGAAPAGNERTVDVQMNRLRRKIERDPGNPQYLQTVRGSGYRLAVD